MSLSEDGVVLAAIFNKSVINTYAHFILLHKSCYGLRGKAQYCHPKQSLGFFLLSYVFLTFYFIER